MHKPTVSLMLFPTAVLLAALPTGCDPRRAADDQPVHCTVVVDGPREVDEQIRARARFRCDLPGAETLTLQIQLQRRDSDTWHSAASDTFTVHDTETTVAELFDYHSREVRADCAGGVYRTVVVWSRESRDDTAGDELISGIIRDPCR